MSDVLVTKEPAYEPVLDPGVPGLIDVMFIGVP